ncbi:MAG TPA: tripartite tricarboxylate transporter substrate binding protein [Burkholderiales bacterium]|jgi:tripartite-type tricarboxylate transporter receptor subunit TctC|nr:tripartite tricarboxylate transporter substrate binding protein [Burkholderiales bacterium]
MRKLAALAALVFAGATWAQTYPAKPITIIVPFTPGSATDVAARLVGEKLNAAWGQPVIVDNRPGAGGTIGIAQTARAEPDGYTLAVVSTGHVVNPVLYKDLPYDTLKDLAGVAPIASLPSVLVVAPGLGVKNVKELVALANAKPGALNYGTAGVGSAAHINSEKFNHAAGIKAVHIPLKGTPPILAETMAGRVHFAWVPSLGSMGLLKDGKLVALAVSTPRRIAALPEVPTIAEAGYPGGEFNFWVGMLAPAKTPREVVAKVNAEVNKALKLPEVIDRLAKLGAEPMSMTPAEFDAFIRHEHDELGKIMRDAGAKPQ